MKQTREAVDAQVRGWLADPGFLSLIHAIKNNGRVFLTWPEIKYWTQHLIPGAKQYVDDDPIIAFAAAIHNDAESKSSRDAWVHGSFGEYWLAGERFLAAPERFLTDDDNVVLAE